MEDLANVSEETQPSSLAVLRFAKGVAKFYHQAEGETKIQEFYDLVEQLFKGRWPQAATPDKLIEARLPIHFFRNVSRPNSYHSSGRRLRWLHLARSLNPGYLTGKPE